MKVPIRNFIFNSHLRRRVRRVFESSGTTMNVAVIGAEYVDRTLFKNIAAVTCLSVEAGVISTVDGANLAACDIVIADVDHAEDLRNLFESKVGAESRILSLAFRAPVGKVEARALEAIGALCDALQMEIVSIQTTPVDFRRDAEILFVLMRPQKVIETDSAALLKSAVILEGFALCSAGLDRIRAYNQLVPSVDDMIGENLIDREYEVDPFPLGEFTAMTRPGGLQPAPEATAGRRESAGPYLSIHFDLFCLPDGERRLISLIRSLARPEHAEILVRVSSRGLAPEFYHTMRGLAGPGPAIKFLADPTPGPNPSSPFFLNETADSAHIVAYFGAEAVPVEAGWDNDLRRMAAGVEGAVFAFKHSRHKTRYLLSLQDVLDAAEGFPVVSRAWFEVCEVWAPPGVPPAQFQTLVAFYFDHIDWMNKHRFMQLIPVMTVHTQPLDVEKSSGASYVLTRANHEHALKLALRLFAREASRRFGLDEFHCTYDYRRGLLTMQLNAPAASIRTFKLRPPKPGYPF